MMICAAKPSVRAGGRRVCARLKSTLRVAGVPEHFNAPFHLAKERGLYEKQGLDMQWHMEPKGTGAMAQLLESNEVDVAVMLAEGATAGIASGAPFKMAGTYVGSPLRWGIHVKADSGIRDPTELKGKVFGVSRMTSGSHLMAHVLAHDLGWDPAVDAPLKVVGALDKAAEAMKSGEIDAWLWEKFTTKFLVEKREFDIIGVVPTRWPCFVFVASDRLLAASEGREMLRALVDVTRPVCTEFKSNQDNTTVEYVSKHHAMSQRDAEEWLSQTEWECKREVKSETLHQTQKALIQIGQLKDSLSPEFFINESVCSMHQDIKIFTQNLPINPDIARDSALRA